MREGFPQPGTPEGDQMTCLQSRAGCRNSKSKRECKNSRGRPFHTSTYGE